MGYTNRYKTDIPMGILLAEDLESQKPRNMWKSEKCAEKRQTSTFQLESGAVNIKESLLQRT